LLSQVPYESVPRETVKLPPRVHNPDYHRGPIPKEMYVPEYIGATVWKTWALSAAAQAKVSGAPAASNAS